MKKAYTTPSLTVHGSVEKITLAPNGDPPFGGPGPPGCNPSDGCVAPGLGSQVGNTGNNPQNRP
ncbi:lasso peptide [Rubrobacter tropicus]|nr:lasso peptide [Rubrobacter tropicus]